MTQKRRRFNRQSAHYKYRKIFVIVTDGSKAESQYFRIFNNQNVVIQIRCFKNTNSSSIEILNRINNYLKCENIIQNYEAWIVVDKDRLPEDQITLLNNWAKSNENYGFALSNPKFAYWLLLHFEDGNNISSTTLNKRLKQYLPGFEKGNVEIKELEPGIQAAIKRAKQKDSPPCHDWPRNTGTTVYRLVEKFLEEG